MHRNGIEGGVALSETDKAILPRYSEGCPYWTGPLATCEELILQF